MIGGPEAQRAPNYRLAIAALWLAVQGSLVLTAGERFDGAFGFRMFSESASIKLTLYREVGHDRARARVRVDGGVWAAAGPDGSVHRLTWYDRVPSPYWVFDQEVHASYGASTQIARLQRALDDVAGHTPEDAETHRLLLDVAIRRNGREPVTVQLASHERPGIPEPSPDQVPAGTGKGI